LWVRVPPGALSANGTALQLPYETSVTPASVIDHLCLVTVLGEQAGELTARLVEDGYQVTEMNSAGGLLQEVQVSLLIGLPHTRLGPLLAHIRDCCRRQRRFIAAHLEGSSSLFQPAIIEAETGGAIVYVFEVERFEQL
jgi:uncharacterized protein YaaQ